MPENVELTLNHRRLTVPAGITVAAALLQAGELHFRSSVTGEPRAPLCGMGICFECGVAIGGNLHARSCQILCEQGMEIKTGK